jgi:hypothetical protein
VSAGHMRSGHDLKCACTLCTYERTQAVTEVAVTSERERILSALLAEFADWDDVGFSAVKRFAAKMREGK